LEEDARQAISENDSPDLTLRYSVNPYRGCFHACAYCFARRTHQYLGFGAGTDFERKLVVKRNIATRLDAELGDRRWEGAPVLLSGNTDPYQPIEASFGLTRACLAACLAHDNPVVLITKGALVRRDLDLCRELARRGRIQAFLSIGAADDRIGRAIEPHAPPPSLRFEVLAELHRAGIPCGVSLAPCIPGLTDTEIPAVLTQAQRAGAQWAFLTMVRLPGEVAPVFLERVREVLPQRAQRIENTIRELRGGGLNDSRFGARLRGRGPRWQAIQKLFELTRRRIGLHARPPALPPRGRMQGPQARLPWD
jgi:DNA repair photolyase